MKATTRSNPTVADVQRILTEAKKRRNSARWAVALALGLRQGETLGLLWTDIDLDRVCAAGGPRTAEVRAWVRGACQRSTLVTAQNDVRLGRPSRMPSQEQAVAASR